MTSRQVMLTVLPAALLALVVCSAGCRLSGPGHKPELTSPHPRGQVWAVAPLNNESGSQSVDALRLTDRLVAHVERVEGIDTLPLNRVLATMQRMEMPAVTSVNEALALRRALNVDAVIAGTVSAYDPYDPPKLGLVVELYHVGADDVHGVDIRGISRAATDQDARPAREGDAGPSQPVVRVSGYFDAADPGTQARLEAYGKQHSVTDKDKTRTGLFTKYDPIGPRLYRISTDLYGDFATFQVVRRLIQAEARRLAPEPTASDDSAPAG
jgi:hypothetical protein